MALKRKRNATKGFATGDKLNLDSIPAVNTTRATPWGWVGSEASEASEITEEHRISACNLSSRNKNKLCPNKYGEVVEVPRDTSPKPSTSTSNAHGELEDDIIVISDDEDAPKCSKKQCKNNPYCLNHLGQLKWEDEDDAWEDFRKAIKLDHDPARLARENDLPVGLKNLGATCYANASLQVWFRDFAFRAGVYSCAVPEGITEEKYKESPISQLQATFAALQIGNQKVFNPTKLVESLQLRTTEQQDAQEFSKLFMTHLDAEFKKQNNPVLKSLITDQFEGKQIYGTMCHSCGNRSERRSEFLELEISFKNNSKLEDCISASLSPETLSGDNKYSCSRCDSLQDATRYTELRQLPPVLHFSLLRFVYDLNTMERKKSKNTISFPPVLDMSKFVGSERDRGHSSQPEQSQHIYELRGVLQHKGASAYHGHYEAQVYDTEHGSWYQFNDESVTKIQSLVPYQKKSGKGKAIVEDDKSDCVEARKKRSKARKRKRIDDSDDDSVVILEDPPSQPKPSERPDLISSKDAYMLIYARKDHQKHDTFGAPQPSTRAVQIIENLNMTYLDTCNAYAEQDTMAKSRFVDLKSKVTFIYGQWTTSPSHEMVVVSRRSLEAWLSEHCIEAAQARHLNDTQHSDASPANKDKISIDCSDIVCQHGCLDPRKANNMKCITLNAYERIVNETHCDFAPSFRPFDACRECVSAEFQEKYYELDHPRHSKEVDEIPNILENESGYWISKKWYKDWRLVKPRMHVFGQDDPAPDSSEFHNHVYCEHGELTLNITNRRKISGPAVASLQKLFPRWDPPSTEIEPCAICDAEIFVSKEDKKELRKLVEDEKARLRFIYEPSLDDWSRGTGIISYAMLSSRFLKDWKRWLHNPSENPRPCKIDNAPLICQHDLLVVDPDCKTDMDTSITIIKRDDWDVLNSIYSGGPLIALSKKSPKDSDGYNHDIPVCADCRLRRKTEWDTADIVIRMSIPNGSSTSKQKGLVTYGRVNGARQSRRLRSLKERGEQRVISVCKASSVKDIKVVVQDEFSVPTICQRLFYQGKELNDNTATIESLNVFANDIIDLKEAEEVLDITSDSDEPPTKRKKEEGSGFGGTLLGSVDVNWSSSPEQTPQPVDKEKACSACTFSNTFDASACQICDTILV
ncbi:cysteine proteinase [Crepidotus variabilis]|uniref:ubiquitinyl hydrolase 1 n=1 Tax=Crepidotus variabilis TaxID=179855 RepID=A0A9P6EDD8_9AGAR|nr:cysteine proteinase [Crepidotus variabilis]